MQFIQHITVYCITYPHYYTMVWSHLDCDTAQGHITRDIKGYYDIYKTDLKIHSLRTISLTSNLLLVLTNEKYKEKNSENRKPIQ